METCKWPGSRRPRPSLETFLSGMETVSTRRTCWVSSALKPSLVEWKLSGEGRIKPYKADLETFLSGMETLVES